MKPLDGVVVVELAGWVAAPSAGAILADLGADVIKVEPPGGDGLRGVMRPPKIEGPRANIDYPFTVDNRGKRSIVIAVDTEEGAGLVRRLAGDADIFLTNMLPHRQTRYGLAPDDLLAAKANLVYAALSGYGLVGPDLQTPGFDVTAFFGRAGVTDTITGLDMDAPMPAAGQGDHVAGLALVGSILAALRLAERTGEGQVVDVNLFATGVWTMASDLSATLIDRRQPSKRSRSTSLAALNNRYRCSDGQWVFLTMPGQQWWSRFCEAIDRPELAEDERFADARLRYQNMSELVAILDDVFALKPLAEWSSILDEAGLIWGPAAQLASVVDDPQAAAIGLWPEIDHPVVGRFPTVASPVSVVGSQVGPAGPAPEIGEQTDEVLAGLGINADEIQRLRSAGVLG